MAPCSLVHRYERVEGTHRIHLEVKSDALQYGSRLPTLTGYMVPLVYPEAGGCIYSFKISATIYTASFVYSKDAGSSFLRNVGSDLPQYNALFCCLEDGGSTLPRIADKESITLQGSLVSLRMEIARSSEESTMI
jgi:hypothetical protein